MTELKNYNLNPNEYQQAMGWLRHRLRPIEQELVLLVLDDILMPNRFDEKKIMPHAVIAGGSTTVENPKKKPKDVDLFIIPQNQNLGEKVGYSNWMNFGELGGSMTKLLDLKLTDPRYSKFNLSDIHTVAYANNEEEGGKILGGRLVSEHGTKPKNSVCIDIFNLYDFVGQEKRADRPHDLTLKEGETAEEAIARNKKEGNGIVVLGRQYSLGWTPEKIQEAIRLNAEANEDTQAFWRDQEMRNAPQVDRRTGV